MSNDHINIHNKLHFDTVFQKKKTRNSERTNHVQIPVQMIPSNQLTSTSNCTFSYLFFQPSFEYCHVLRIILCCLHWSIISHNLYRLFHVSISTRFKFQQSQRLYQQIISYSPQPCQRCLPDKLPDVQPTSSLIGFGRFALFDSDLDDVRNVQCIEWLNENRSLLIA